MKAAAGIESDYDLAEVLVDVVKDGGLTDRTAPSFFAALPQIGSDYDHRRVLQAVAQATVSDGALAQATATTSGMNSDYDRAESLVAISRSKAVGPSTRKALADAVQRHRQRARSRPGALSADPRRSSDGTLGAARRFDSLSTRALAFREVMGPAIRHAHHHHHRAFSLAGGAVRKVAR